jgi:serine protease
MSIIARVLPFLALAVPLLTAGTAGAGELLRLDPDDPPIVVTERPDLAPGAVTLRFFEPRLVEVDALPAAIVLLERGDEPPAELVAEGVRLGGPNARSWRVPAVPPEDALDVALRWAAHPAVVSAMPDLVLPRERTVAFDDPMYDGQWYHELLESQLLWEQTLGDPEVRVAVIDSAIELSHPDLADGFVAPYDAFDDDADPSPNPGEFCFDSNTDICDEHGTAVSGIIGARANNAEGVVGFCPECSVVPIKLLGDSMGSTGRDVAAYEHAIEQDAWVINNSWGYTVSIPAPDVLADLIHEASTENRDGLGAVVVFAAGNDDRDIEDDEIQVLPDVLCVSATDRYGNWTNYTNRGPGVDISAPSATVTTSYEGGYTETFGGTSAAAPVAAGVAGWLLAWQPQLTSEEVRQLMVDTAVQNPGVTSDDDGHHDIFGYGLLSPVDLIDAFAEEPPTDDGGQGCSCESALLPRGAATLPALLLLALIPRRRRGTRRS